MASRLYLYQHSVRISLDDAFQTSVDCRNIVLDEFKLPKDNCKLIAAAIEKGTAIAVCDR